MLLTQVLRWAHWWNSTEAIPHDVSNEQVVIELNTGYSTRGLAANEIIAVVQAWQNGAPSRDSMLNIFRRGEVLPEGRTNEEEVRPIALGNAGTRAAVKAVKRFVKKGCAACGRVVRRAALAPPGSPIRELSLAVQGQHACAEVKDSLARAGDRLGMVRASAPGRSVPEMQTPVLGRGCRARHLEDTPGACRAWW